MKSRVAVYGTLREGEYNHHLLAKSGSTCLGSTFIPQYIMLNLGNFPGVVPCRKEEWEVFVEVYEVDADTLKKLDALEGVGREFYDRVNVDTPLFGKVFLYVLNPKYFELLYNSRRSIHMQIGGDWMEEDSYTLEDEDIRSEITEEYLKKASIIPLDPRPPTPPATEVKQLLAPVPAAPVLPSPKWDQVFGSVSEAPLVEEVINA